MSHHPSLLSYTGAGEGTWVLMTARQALPTQPSLQPHDEIILETASDSRTEMETFPLPPLLFPFPVEKPYKEENHNYSLANAQRESLLTFQSCS